MDVRDFIGFAVHPLRLSLMGHAADGSIDLEAIASAHGVKERTVRVELGKLRASGLIDDAGLLNLDVLRSIAQALPQEPPMDDALVAAGWSEDEAVVLSRFFSGDRLTSIPASHSKRYLVLERLAQEFEPGMRYGEAEVNFMLQLFHEDYAALRRYLVDDGLLTRAEGVYWRTGGRYLTQAEPAVSSTRTDNIGDDV